MQSRKMSVSPSSLRAIATYVLLILIQLIVIHGPEQVLADNVVFVHGLYGWGPDEFLGVSYWGFSKIFGKHQDYLEMLRRRGHRVFYASVGPLSSNHDRACELYAQIVGTRVDYGLVHSRKHNHTRYGKDYSGKGFLPQFGANRRIHFVGHSMGGNTIRYLEYLIQHGLPEEEAETTDGSLSPLFKTHKLGGNNWIQSITTIGTPHNGSPMNSKPDTNMTSVAINVLSAYGLAAGLGSLDVDWIYNFDLEHFGLARGPKESFKSYFNRIFASSVFQPGFVDFASHDLQADQARIFNNKTELAYPGTYYFSFSASQTFTCSWDGDECPELDMEVFMMPLALSNGHLGDEPLCLQDPLYCFKKTEWSENDGLVPRKSSRGPELGVRNYVEPTPYPRTCTLFKCRYDDSSLRPGVWYNRHVKRDHVQQIGLRFNLLEPDASGGIYTDLANTIDAIRAPYNPDDNLVIQDSQSGDDDYGTEESEDTSVPLAGIVVPIVLSVGFVAIAAAVVITRRRRSQQQITNKNERQSVVSTLKTQSVENPLFQLQSRSQNDV